MISEAPVETCNQFVFLAFPRRPGWKPKGEQPGQVLCTRPSGRGKMKLAASNNSLLCFSFNLLWSAAMNHRAAGLTHFGMQHDDIIPPLEWVDILVDDLEASSADVISSVVPIKDDRGITSTGVRNWLTGEIRRLTMHEVFQFPETFTIEDVHAAGIKANPNGNPADEYLIVNTGLWVCRFDRPWAKKFPGFRTQDQVRIDADGRCEAVSLSEDWLFSEWAARNGLSVLATRKAALGHWQDGKEYRNDHPWGTCQTDPGEVVKVT